MIFKNKTRIFHFIFILGDSMESVRKKEKLLDALEIITKEL